MNAAPEVVIRDVTEEEREALKDGSTQLMLTKTLIYSDIGDLLGNPVGVANITVSSNAETTTTT